MALNFSPAPALGRFFFCSLLAVNLAGCSLFSGFFPWETGYGTDPVSPPEGARHLMTLTGKGTQVFQCTPDKQGRYWRFVTPQATLTDQKHRIVAEHGADFTFVARDGSRLTSKIVKYSAGADAASLKNVLFETTSSGKQGILTGVRWVKRTGAKGGVPLTACSASQIGMVLRRPFVAEYAFYK